MTENFVWMDLPYILKSKQRLKVNQIKTSAYGLETASFRGSQIWNILGNSFKQLSSVNSFKQKHQEMGLFKLHLQNLLMTHDGY